MRMQTIYLAKYIKKLMKQENLNPGAEQIGDVQLGSLDAYLIRILNENDITIDKTQDYLRNLYLIDKAQNLLN